MLKIVTFIIINELITWRATKISSLTILAMSTNVLRMQSEQT